MIKIKNSTLGWIICTLAAIFYCYEYLLRIAPSVMVPELMQTFQATATEFGILSAFFYFAYTPMQIIVGMLLDLYGPRRILTLAVITCTIGSYVFSISDIILVAAIGRALIGFGSAFAFVCVLKLTHSWLPQRFFALFVGLATALGMLGAIFQITILGSFVQNLGWKQTINIGTIVGVCLVPLIWLIVRDKPEDRASRKNKINTKPQYYETFIGFLKILKNPQMWINGFIGCLMYLSLSAFAEMWGIRSLTVIYQTSVYSAGLACSLVFLGWLVGSPLIGYISDITNSRKIPIAVGCLISSILIALIIYLPQMNMKLLYTLTFLFGVFSSCEVLCFAVSSENNPKTLIATASAFTNFLIMISGSTAQPLVGKILDAAWSGRTLDGIRIYSAANYQLALTILPIGFLLGFVLTFWLKETGHKKTY
ncbi:MAG: MFS transporter [Gammaproteobacteria bacterium]|nr:MFS transporter [Gammaproteobacteria bacterium]